MINFNTDRLIIFCYPRYAGGKFLINSLGLSDDCLFQSAPLAEAQLEAKFTQSDKLNYLLTSLEAVTYDWDDLHLGCHYFFGPTNYDYVYNVPLKFNPVVEKSINDNKYFFLVTHNNLFLTKYISHWKNPKIVQFTDYYKFIDFYNRVEQHHTKYHQEVWDQSMNLAIERTSLDKITWNTDWYFSKKETIEQIYNLYVKLNLGNFNEQAIATYYDEWIAALLRIKKRKEDENNA